MCESTIGLLLCRDKNNVEVEFPLRGMTMVSLGTCWLKLRLLMVEGMKNEN